MFVLMLFDATEKNWTDLYRTSSKILVKCHFVVNKPTEFPKCYSKFKLAVELSINRYFFYGLAS